MEWVSFIAGEPHSDDPSCVSPVLRAYCTALNDSLDHGPRQRLRPYLARTIGTAADDSTAAVMDGDGLADPHISPRPGLPPPGLRHDRRALADCRQ